MELQSLINEVWNNRELLKEKKYSDAVKAVIEDVDKGKLRTAEPIADEWKVNEWVKQAILLYFGVQPMQTWSMPPFEFYDRIELKKDFAALGVRTIPGAIARYGAYVARNVVQMPSFINIGAYVDEGTMVDTWATVGSCAQIGSNVHISGGAGIGGVLEPLQAGPVIIGDGAFVGARAEVAEGVRVGEGAVLSMGVYLGASTKIIDRATGEVHRGVVPPYAVVVPGSTGGGDGKPGLYCAVIVKTVDAQTRSKTGINELLRD
jgi:2,3,4,5-tetrahydropyridine-2-carboxylate N-succinyltransferase